MFRSPVLVALLSLFLCACHLRFRDGVTVDGVRLRAHHEEVLAVDSWSSAGLHIEAHQGDVRIEPTDGPSTITVELHEASLDQAHAAYQDGRLEARTQDGTPCAIGKVVVRTRGPIPGLFLATGCGDIELHDVTIQGALELSSGLGDIDVRGVGEPERIEFETGKGDIRLADARCARCSAHSGLGDLHIEQLTAGEAELSSGLGDVAIQRSKFERVQADTGLGDIDCSESSYQTSDFDTGLGSVRTR